MDRNKQARHKATGVIFEWGKHWEMWNELAESGSKDKLSCSNSSEIVNLDGRCFACNSIKHYLSCGFCPLILDCNEDDSYFEVWRNANNTDKIKQYAAKIRDAKLSPEWEEI